MTSDINFKIQRGRCISNVGFSRKEKVENGKKLAKVEKNAIIPKLYYKITKRGKLWHYQ
jgi:hypothetical protein